MKNTYKVAAILCALILIGSACAMAATDEAGAGFADVPADAWYAEAAAYCRDNGIMSGVTETEFAPQQPMSRAMLATVLWRMEGSPTVAATQSFADVAPGQWYSEAIAWAASAGIISGYNAQTFGPGDPVTREQAVALLYRFAEYNNASMEVSTGPDFADTGDIAGWAYTAAAWAKENGIISGWPGELFDPKSDAKRAEVADALYRYVEAELAEPPTDAAANTDSGRILVAYFSRTGNTETLANYIQELSGGDLFEIVPVDPYPTDYNECLSQARVELDNDYRPALSSQVQNMAGYDVIFVGYPIWYGNTPMAIRSFLEEYDMSGKTIVPFCTHGGSGLGQSVEAIKALCPASTILDGLAVPGAQAANSRDAVSAWLEELGIAKNEAGDVEVTFALWDE